MADRRRRRRRASQDSEDESGSGSGSDSGRSGSPATKARGRDVVPEEPVEARREEAKKSDVESECESEDEAEAVLSDYDSAEPEENGSPSEGAEEEAEGYSEEEAVEAGESKPSAAVGEGGQEGEVEGEGDHEKEEGKAEEKGNLAGERQSGDGQESTDHPETKAAGKPGQQLDDDEDRKNPAYIPRKGLFFEHDVRGPAQEDERPKGRNRKLWKDEGRWEHDRFREEEQAPKSREELIAIYGYDIRNGAGPAYRQRQPRQNTSQGRDKRWREGAERPARSWQNRTGGAPPSSVPPPSAFPPLSAAQRNHTSRAPPSRNRPPHHSQAHPPPPPRNEDAPHRERQVTKTLPEPAGERGGASRGGRGAGKAGSSVLGEDVSPDGATEPPQDSSSAVLLQTSRFRSASPRRQDTRPSAPPHGPQASSGGSNPDASPPPERPVERKSYSLARRTRSRPADLGSKQTSVEESAAGGSASPSSGGGKGWIGGGEGASQTGGGTSELDQDVARLSLSGPNWSQNPASYVRSEVRGLGNPVHLPNAPPQFSSMDDLGGGAGRAKRYSSQRQRAVPEPAPPMHLGVMEGHFYEPMSYQGPIYTHSDGPAPIPPQSMLVQPEMHLPHPGLHPHQSGGPIANPTLYGAPPVSLSPGQPQQLLPPPFYPPPGVMTFPYPTMYPTPQGQAQVTYGGVTYYDTMQQQAQPKPSPPRRTSQPVTVKPPPPEVPFASE
ncbi:protein CASC3 isoform X2 [Oryzias latipes]|uniref:Protein CASC3 n=1 Tax=Oryzias latipes TaxID=8090 RepID=A0A3B3IID2_ORYLA|nr:protein CASC3 isoform X2 [Oryzias latipes]